MSVDALHDALNAYGLGYFGVVSQGKSFECHMGPDHIKKVKRAHLLFLIIRNWIGHYLERRTVYRHPSKISW